MNEEFLKESLGTIQKLERIIYAIAKFRLHIVLCMLPHGQLHILSRLHGSFNAISFDGNCDSNVVKSVSRSEAIALNGKAS